MRLSSVVFFALAGVAAAANKRGLSWPWYNENTSLTPAKFSNGGKVKWMYNWETWRPAKTPGVNFIGMQATKDSASSPIGELANRAKQQGWTDVFSLNEPDVNGISPADAAAWYKQHIAPLAIHKGLPAVTSSTNGGQGLDWLQQFMNACNGKCPHDYINLHWYGHSLDAFKTHIQNAHKRFPSQKIVISEFALQAPASGSAQANFFNAATKWLDGLNYVVMYFPFVGTSPQLMQAHDGGAVSYVGTGCALFNNDGSVSAAGKALIN